MMAISHPTWQLLQQVIISLIAAAVAVLWSTWSKSPNYLPLPQSPQRRWLRSVPILATAVIIGILSTWFTDCVYLWRLTVVAGAALILCIVLMILHHHLLGRLDGASTVLVIICFGWSTLGTLAVASTGTMLIAKENMDDAYRNSPLTLWQLVEREKRNPSIIYLTSNLSAHFRTEMDDCHESLAEMNITPQIGRLFNGTYTAPETIKEEQEITLIARSPWHHDTKTATIILLPDSPNIKRVQYSGEDTKKRQAVFDFIIISKSDSWVFGSDELVEKNKLEPREKISERSEQVPVCKPVLSLAQSHQFDPYVHVIAIGTASREGSQVEEEDRADRRSKRIAEWVNLGLQNTSQSKHVYAMNLGQYQAQPEEKSEKRSHDATAGERPVVLIGVVPNGDVDLTEALQNVLDRHQENEFFKFLAIHYPGRQIITYTRSAASRCN